MIADGRTPCPEMLWNSLNKSELNIHDDTQLSLHGISTVELSTGSGPEVRAGRSRKTSTKVGRTKYTEMEDDALEKFVLTHVELKVGGNVLWKEAAQQKVTPHSWQSMRDRYLKRILPRTKQREWALSQPSVSLQIGWDSSDMSIQNSVHILPASSSQLLLPKPSLTMPPLSSDSAPPNSESSFYHSDDQDFSGTKDARTVGLGPSSFRRSILGKRLYTEGIGVGTDKSPDEQSSEGVRRPRAVRCLRGRWWEKESLCTGEGDDEFADLGIRCSKCPPQRHLHTICFLADWLSQWAHNPSVCPSCPRCSAPITTSWQWTRMLYAAIRTADEETFLKVLYRGEAYLSTRSVLDLTLLHYAAATGTDEMIKQLASQMKWAIAVVDVSGKLPIDMYSGSNADVLHALDPRAEQCSARLRKPSDWELFPGLSAHEVVWNYGVKGFLQLLWKDMSRMNRLMALPNVLETAMQMDCPDILILLSCMGTPLPRLNCDPSCTYCLVRRGTDVEHVSDMQTAPPSLCKELLHVLQGIV